MQKSVNTMPIPEIKLNTIEEAIEDIKNGKLIIVVDDENRENEGDFIAAAECVTPEMINFMATHGRGLICAPLTESRCKELELNMMVENNTVLHHTQFTVSVDLIGHGCTTGISAQDRAKTITALTDSKTQAKDLGRPGHIFPLKAKQGGVLRRTGHTEAAVDLARLAGYKPMGILVEILNADGSMARLPELMGVAQRFDLKIISIEDLVAYRMKHDSLILKKSDFEIETRFGTFRFRAYQQTTNNKIHIALTKGDWQLGEVVLTRINSSRVNHDILGTLTDSADKRLDDMFSLINKKGKGAILFLDKEIPAENSLQRIHELEKSQQKGKLIKAPKIEIDTKDFGIGAQILHDLHISHISLITNRKQAKRVGITGYGLKIEEYVNF